MQRMRPADKPREIAGNSVVSGQSCGPSRCRQYREKMLEECGRGSPAALTPSTTGGAPGRVLSVTFRRFPAPAACRCGGAFLQGPYHTSGSPHQQPIISPQKC